jgi:hypothetical protein
MTQAQKVAKEKFKKAIEYRKKTGVSLKEAFAHIYRKKVGAVKKKVEPKKKAATKKAALKKSMLNGIKQKFIFDIYKRNEYGDHIPSSKKSVSIVRSNSISAKDFLYKKYPSSKYFIELESAERIGAMKKKSASKKATPKKKSALEKVASKRMTDIHKDSKSHNVNIRVVSGMNYNDPKILFDELLYWQKQLDKLRAEYRSPKRKMYKKSIMDDIKLSKKWIENSKKKIREHLNKVV